MATHAKKFPYTLKTGTHTRQEDGELVKYDSRGPHKVIDLTREEAASPTFRGRVEEVLQSDVDDEEEAVDIGAMKVLDAADYIKDLGTLEEAVAFTDAEKAGKNRNKVVAAGESRIEELASR